MDESSAIGKMHTSVTLICNPLQPAMTEDLVRDLFLGCVECSLAGLGASQRWLRAGAAAEFLFERSAEPKALRTYFTQACGDLPIDVVVQPAEGRRKRLLVADMDSTIIGQECIDELAGYAGKRAEIAAITERAMRGEIDFEAALIERVAMLKGLPEPVLEETFETRIRLNPGAATLVRTMKKLGAATALVSGGFTFFTERVARAAGFDTHQANTLIVKNGVLTGEVAKPILGRAAKEEALVRIAREKSVPLSQTLAVGDGANDLDMLRRAGLGVAYRAKPAVAGAAGARINHGDLTALLYLQGVPHTEFVER
jgi:phosphoserine phosphatase